LIARAVTVENKYQRLVKRLELEPVEDPVRLSEKDLRAFESAIGAELPADFREFLSRYGFVSGVDVVFPAYGQPGQPGGGVEVFLGVDPDSEYDIQATREGLSGRLPDHFLPIAESPGGQICLSLSGADRGKIFWWGLESTAGADAPPLLVADDFDSFINSLHISPC
jgi:hypothetical protein